MDFFYRLPKVATWVKYNPIFLYSQRLIRVEPPLANARTSSTVAIVVSPGKVVISAPCAQPRCTASSSEFPIKTRKKILLQSHRPRQLGHTLPIRKQAKWRLAG